MKLLHAVALAVVALAAVALPAPTSARSSGADAGQTMVTGEMAKRPAPLVVPGAAANWSTAQHTITPSDVGNGVRTTINTASPAAQQTTAVAPSADPPGILAVGTPTRTTIDRASLFQCPGEHCNQGEASTGDNVRAICRFAVKRPDGRYWNWVLNISNGHTGYISTQWLTVPTITPCLEVGDLNYTNQNWWVTMYQCPSRSCNTATLGWQNPVRVVCYWPTPGETTWLLVLNFANSAAFGQVGFVDGRLVNSNPRTLCF